MKLKRLTAAMMMLSFSSIALADFKIQDIRLEGLQQTEPSTVFAYMPIKVGDTFTDDKSEDVIKKLYATGFFDDVRVETQANQVLVSVIERPIVSTVNITGARMLPKDAIKTNFSMFGVGEALPFNQSTLNQAIDGLKQEYINRGKLAVEITPEVVPLARNRVGINIKIDEGETTKITTIKFEGNEHYSNGKLKDQMLLTGKNFWSWITHSNQFNSEKFSTDLEKVSEFYQNNGYLNFQIVDTDIQYSDDQTEQVITIKVNEGQRFKWGSVTLEGDTKEVSRAELEKLIKIKSGKWYDRSQMIKALKAIQHKMGTEGYALSEISVQPMPNPDTGIVDFVLHVDAGRKVYVNEINIVGNNKTRDEVIRREFRQMESAPYDAAKIDRSKNRLEMLGYFEDSNLEVKPVPEAVDQVDIDVAVKERSTGSIDAGLGYVQGTGLVISAGVAQDNLFGSGKSVSARVQRTKTTNSGSISFTDPYFTPDGVSLGYDFYGLSYDPRKSDTKNKKLYKTITAGSALKLGVPINEYDRVNFSFGPEYRTVQTFDNAPLRYRQFIDMYGTGKDGIGKFKGWLFKGGVGWGRNKTDSAIWPTRGYITGVSLDGTLPGGKLQYYSVTHNQTWFFPISNSFTLMLGGDVGYANGYGKTKELPFFENFYGGGLGSVRGYEDSSLGPKVYDENLNTVNYGGNKKANMTAELLFPMPGIKNTRSVRLSLFADAGSVWDGKTYGNNIEAGKYVANTVSVYGDTIHKSSFKNELRYSAGVALTWISPLGPIKISYAYPIHKKETDEVKRFQFQLGTVF